jgi:hypothetical protein
MLIIGQAHPSVKDPDFLTLSFISKIKNDLSNFDIL